MDLSDHDMSLHVHQFYQMPPLVQDVDNGGGYSRDGQGTVWETSVPSAQFCCEPKTALKSKVY